MKFVADLHLHSHFSRATSKNLNLEHLSKWAQLKGIQVIGTGDIAHPGWLSEMKKKLEPAEDGLFKLKNEYSSEIQQEVFAVCRGSVRFMLAGEISNIYKKHDKVRKIHNVAYSSFKLKRPSSAGSSFSFISFSQPGWAISPVPTT